MKTMRGVIICAAACVSVGWGQVTVDPNLVAPASLEVYQRCDMVRYEKAYEHCLLSDNNGVVESAIREVLLIKLAQPNVQCDRIASALEELRVNGATPIIRLKASLAKYVYDNPAMFAEEGIRSYSWDTDVFGVITDRLRESVFVTTH